MKRVYILTSLLIYLISSGISLASESTASFNREKKKAEWTYMVYLYEDGTGLDGNKDLNEWEELGSVPDKINYIALYDCNNDAKDGIYYITKDPKGYNNTLVSKIVSTEFNKGLDMNDAETLKKFTIWCKENYPAKHYGCNVWDHGDGIFKSTNKDWKAACGEMKVWDLANAMKAFKEVDGKGFDIFGFDVCLLGQVETVHAIKDYTDVVIASEKTEPGDGWHYRTQFQMLNDNPELDIYEFAREIVIKYDESYDGGIQGTRATTQTATRTDYYKSDFVPALNKFAEGIIPELNAVIDEVRAARNATWYSDGFRFKEHRDLGHFLKLLKSKASISQSTKANIDELIAAYEKCIVETAQNERPNATGLKIWMPTDISKNKNKDYYLDADKYLNISETKWDEFLKQYENPVVVGKPKAVIKTSGGLSGRKNMTVNFTDKTNCLPEVTSRKWTFSPNTVEYVKGSETDKEIKVRFTEAGTYSVSLSVTNAEGTDVSTQDKMVQVRELVFPAPVNLTKQVNNNTVQLTWEKTNNVSRSKSAKIQESFENDWLPEGWEAKYSTSLNGSHQPVTASGEKKWFKIESSSFNGKGQDYCHSGTHAAGIHYSARGVNWLITPEFETEIYDKLAFWLHYKDGVSQYTGNTYHTSFRVMVLSEGNWNQELYYYNADNNLYNSEVVVDLKKYLGKTIKVAFVYEYTDGFQLAIDDVRVYRDAPDGAPDGYFDHYNVYRNNKKIAETKDLNYADKLTEGGKFTYHITSVYKSLDGESAASNSQVVNKEALKGATPTNLNAKLNSDNHSVTLNWEKGEGATADFESYKLYRDNKLIATINETKYTDQLEKKDANYTYKVTAVYGNGVGETDASNEVNIQVAVSGIDNPVLSSLKIQPNPSNGNFIIALDEAKGANWSLYNLLGNRIKYGVITELNTQVNISRAGIYLLHIEHKGNSIVEKIIIR